MIVPPVSLPKSLHHWYRSVIAFPDGALVHDGDCRIYDSSLHLCTCGLLHALTRIDDVAMEVYPKFEGEMVLHESACNIIRKHSGRRNVAQPG